MKETHEDIKRCFGRILSSQIGSRGWNVIEIFGVFKKPLCLLDITQTLRQYSEKNNAIEIFWEEW